MTTERTEDDKVMPIVSGFASAIEHGDVPSQVAIPVLLKLMAESSDQALAGIAKRALALCARLQSLPPATRKAN